MMTEKTNTQSNTDDKRTTTRKRTTALDRLLSQGVWAETTVPHGATVPALVMPTPELQAELEAALEKRLKQRLKDAGFKRVCGPNRAHPFHSKLLRERLDGCVGGGDGRVFADGWETEEREAFLEVSAIYGTPTDDIEDHIAYCRKRALDNWREAFERYREVRNNPRYYKDTNEWRHLFPEGDPMFVGGPPPPPVFVSDTNIELVMHIADGFVNLYVKQSAL